VSIIEQTTGHKAARFGCSNGDLNQKEVAEMELGLIVCWRILSPAEETNSLGFRSARRMVRCNEKHLLRVLQNLLVSDIKYRTEAPVEIQVSAEWQGQGWVTEVKAVCNGPETRGVGIVLAICRKIIEAMGRTESEPGSGSTFCFTVAAAEEIVPVRSAEPSLSWDRTRNATSETTGRVAQHAEMRKAAGAA
jgi:signal transduction histidine kinase